MTALRAYYLGTPLFMLFDLRWGLNVRAVALEHLPAARYLYYAFCLACARPRPSDEAPPRAAAAGAASSPSRLRPSRCGGGWRTWAYIPVSGGLFRDFSIHDFDVIRWLVGAEVEEVYADGGVRGFEVFRKYGDVDTAVATLRLGDGTLAVLDVARHDPLGYDIRTEVFGSKDSVAVGLGPRTPIRSVEPGVPPPAGPTWQNFLVRFESAYRAELGEFARVARGAALAGIGRTLTTATTRSRTPAAEPFSAPLPSDPRVRRRPECRRSAAFIDPSSSLAIAGLGTGSGSRRRPSRRPRRGRAGVARARVPAERLRRG